MHELQERNFTVNLYCGIFVSLAGFRESQSISLILFLNILWSQKWLVIQKLHQESKDRQWAYAFNKCSSPRTGKRKCLPVLRLLGIKELFLVWPVSFCLQKQVSFPSQPSIYLTKMHGYKSQGLLDVHKVLNFELSTYLQIVFLPSTTNPFVALISSWLSHQWSTKQRRLL